MNQEQKLEVISTVYSDLNSIYSTPLKTKVAMVAQDTLNAIPVIRGIDITVLKAELDSCIKIWVEMSIKYFKYSDGSEYKQLSRNCNGIMSTWLKRVK